MIGIIIVLYILTFYTVWLHVKLNQLEEDLQKLRKTLLDKKVIDYGDLE